jgi:2-dehydro-3-deoxygalactonokinase
MKPSWIAVDWGTSNLRFWTMGSNGKIMATGTSDRGMNNLTRDEFEPVLLELIQPYLDNDHVIPVICCGMVGARQGWADAGYVVTPCAIPNGKTAIHVPSKDNRISVRIVSGIKQMSPADVMRGEETQIAGFLRLNPKFDGVVCLPGTHSKWVHISANEVVSFQTFMTGEIFNLLSTQSVLRHSVDTDEFDETSFNDGLSESMSRPQMIAANLFGLRAAGLVADQSSSVAKSKLSGLLIGAELAGSRPYWLGQNVVIIGADTLAHIYQSALSTQGVDAKMIDVSEMTVSGLTAVHDSLS